MSEAICSICGEPAPWHLEEAHANFTPPKTEDDSPTD